jgi:hypothetical protein
MSKRVHARSRQVMRQTQQKWIELALATAGIVMFSALLAVHAAQASPEAPPLPAAKAQLQAREQQEMADARAHARPKVAGVRPAAQAAPAREAGISEMHQGPFSGTVFAVRNFWQGPVGANWLLVYAGATRNADGSTAAGALRVYTEAPTPDGGFSIHLVGVFTAARGDALTISAANGTVLTLRSDMGATLTFNLATTSFM